MEKGDELKWHCPSLEKRRFRCRLIEPIFSQVGRPWLHQWSLTAIFSPSFSAPRKLSSIKGK
ncbi:hypothetical protein TorRG33x02_260460 [Trema orientale]|uniref:Uncharacterized protein n=2 Tax=Cannabaceae TaxID=3481 RepID=A0A2P5B8S9_PARAD|nr:hypothetical protein PanWU01x14_260270 [Parasponia andersonii]PON69005.1 hypothetical protein TorRG33x02_260460 [Trema orientale]